MTRDTDLLEQSTCNDLSDYKAQILLDILNENSAEELVNFPIRCSNLLKLFITRTSDQF